MIRKNDASTKKNEDEEKKRANTNKKNIFILCNFFKHVDRLKMAFL